MSLSYDDRRWLQRSKQLLGPFWHYVKPRHGRTRRGALWMYYSAVRLHRALWRAGVEV